MRTAAALLTFSLLVSCSASESSETPPDPADDTVDAVDAAPEPDVPDVEAPPTYPTAPEFLGGGRPANYVLPDQYDSAESWPLLLLLHGYGANIGNAETHGGLIQDAYLGLSKRSSELGFLMLIPHGTADAVGNQFWNATPACCDFAKTGVDDVAYLTGLLDEAAAYFNVDPKRVYLLGHSNGGFMSYRLACEAGERFAGMVSIAGSTFDSADACSPGTSKLSVLQVHGTVDETIPYAGDPGRYPSAADAAARWAGRNGCAAEPDTAAPLDLVSGENGDEAVVTRYDGCADGTAVELWTLENVGHIPAFTEAFSTEALGFLLARSRP